MRCPLCKVNDIIGIDQFCPECEDGFKEWARSDLPEYPEKVGPCHRCGKEGKTRWGLPGVYSKHPWCEDCWGDGRWLNKCATHDCWREGPFWKHSDNPYCEECQKLSPEEKQRNAWVNDTPVTDPANPDSYWSAQNRELRRRGNFTPFLTNG